MRTVAGLPILLLLVAGCATGDPAGHAGHAGHMAPGGASDARVAVAFPEAMRAHLLANMRDHLAALHEIQQALAEGAFERAAQVSERRLGMTSLEAHGAHDAAKFMPEGMRAAGTQMHRAASRFSVAAADAGATGDLRPALASLSMVTAQCVACHAAYRLK